MWTNSEINRFLWYKQYKLHLLPSKSWVDFMKIKTENGFKCGQQGSCRVRSKSLWIKLRISLCYRLKWVVFVNKKFTAMDACENCSSLVLDNRNGVFSQKATFKIVQIRCLQLFLKVFSALGVKNLKNRPFDNAWNWQLIFAL